MDSLLASYASSDEEDNQPQTNPTISLSPPPPSSRSSSLFSSLPKPQSSVFSSLPPPKSSSETLFSLPTPNEHLQKGRNSNPNSKPSALFSSLPAPKTLATPDFHLPPPNPKRVVQFRPPVPLPSKDEDDDEDEEGDEEERERKKQRQLGQDTSVKSFLSSMPVPRNSAGNTLGAAPSSGSGRRSVIATEAPEPTSSGSNANGVNSEVGSSAYNQEVEAAGDQSYAGYEGVGAHGSSGGYDSYWNYANYENYANYDTSSGAMASGASGAMMPEITGGIESFVNMDGRRRKGKVPTQIVEVKQDELMKNRPREDQSKMTGLAFGPSYQPVPSTKGKPTKLAKRKHQIGSLYFDLKQKEMELAERRSKGLLTKAETQAKYGW